MEKLKQEYNSVKHAYRELDEQRFSLRKLENQCRKRVCDLQKRVESLRTEDKIAWNRDRDEYTVMDNKVEDMLSTFPKPTRLFLQLMVGNIPMTLPYRDDRLAYKQSYETFKLWNVVVIFCLSVTSLLLIDNPLPSALLHCWSAVYYFTVTLREMILMNNGSRIKAWWLVHHYFSIVIAAVMLIWPPGKCYRAFKPNFLLFSCFLSLVMLLQFRYQKGKLYRQIAMGQKHHMSISSEGSKVSKMSFLVVCLTLTYLFQLYNAYVLLWLHLWSGIECQHWEVPVLAVLFLIIAVGNCSTLSSVIYGKSRKKQY